MGSARRQLGETRADSLGVLDSFRGYHNVSENARVRQGPPRAFNTQEVSGAGLYKLQRAFFSMFFVSNQTLLFLGIECADENFNSKSPA